MCMITRYISEQLAKAKYKLLSDGTYFGEVPGLDGVWASGKTLEKCRSELAEIIESWLFLKIRKNIPIPGMQTKKIRTENYAKTRVLA